MYNSSNYPSSLLQKDHNSVNFRHHSTSPPHQPAHQIPKPTITKRVDPLSYNDPPYIDGRFQNYASDPNQPDTLPSFDYRKFYEQLQETSNIIRQYQSTIIPPIHDTFHSSFTLRSHSHHEPRSRSLHHYRTSTSHHHHHHHSPLYPSHHVRSHLSSEPIHPSDPYQEDLLIRIRTFLSRPFPVEPESSDFHHPTSALHSQIDSAGSSLQHHYLDQTRFSLSDSTKRSKETPTMTLQHLITPNSLIAPSPSAGSPEGEMEEQSEEEESSIDHHRDGFNESNRRTQTQTRKYIDISSVLPSEIIDTPPRRQYTHIHSFTYGSPSSSPTTSLHTSEHHHTPAHEHRHDHEHSHKHKHKHR